MENLKQPLQLLYCFAFLYCHGSNALAAVHRGAATKGYHGLTAIFLKQLKTLVYISVRRIRLNSVVNHIFNSALVHGFKHSLWKT